MKNYQRIIANIAYLAVIAVLIASTTMQYTAQAQSSRNQTHNLLSLYNIALNSDAQLQMATRSFAAAQLNKPIAQSDLLPQLNLNISQKRITDQKIRGTFFGQDSSGASGSRSSSYSDYDIDTLRLDLRQTLFNMKQFIAFSQSKSEVTAAQLEHQDAQQDLILRLAKAYFGVLSAESMLEFARSEKDAYAQQREQAQERFNVGLVPITDAKEAQAAYDIATANEIAAENDLRNAFYALTIIVNLDIEKLMKLDDNLTINSPIPEDMQQWVEKALAGNLDLLAKKIRVNIAHQEIRRQGSGHLPSIDLVAAHNESDIRGGPAPRDYEDEQIGVEFNIPLLAGGKVYYQTKQAAERYHQTTYELQQMQREVTNTARESYLNVITAINRTQALEQAIESAQAAVAATQAGFNVGTRTSTDVLLILRDLFKAQYDYAETRHTYVLNMLRLKNVVGALSAEDINQVNSWLTKSP